MNVFHTDTDVLRQQAQTLRDQAQTLQHWSNALKNDVQTLLDSWQGLNAGQYVDRFGQNVQAMERAAQELDHLREQLEQEAEKWELVDQRFGADQGPKAPPAGTAQVIADAPPIQAPSNVAMQTTVVLIQGLNWSGTPRDLEAIKAQMESKYGPGVAVVTVDNPYGSYNQAGLLARQLTGDSAFTQALEGAAGGYVRLQEASTGSHQFSKSAVDELMNELPPDRFTNGMLNRKQRFVLVGLDEGATLLPGVKTRLEMKSELGEAEFELFSVGGTPIDEKNVQLADPGAGHLSASASDEQIVNRLGGEMRKAEE